MAHTGFWPKGVGFPGIVGIKWKNTENEMKTALL